MFYLLGFFVSKVRSYIKECVALWLSHANIVPLFSFFFKFRTYEPRKYLFQFLTRSLLSSNRINKTKTWRFTTATKFIRTSENGNNLIARFLLLLRRMGVFC